MEARVSFKYFVNGCSFESHLIISDYTLLVWTQNANSIKIHLVLQKKSLRIITFLKRNAHISNLFKTLSVLNLLDKVTPRMFCLKGPSTSTYVVMQTLLLTVVFRF